MQNINLTPYRPSFSEISSSLMPWSKWDWHSKCWSTRGGRCGIIGRSDSDNLTLCIGVHAPATIKLYRPACSPLCNKPLAKHSRAECRTRHGHKAYRQNVEAARIIVAAVNLETLKAVWHAASRLRIGWGKRAGRGGRDAGKNGHCGESAGGRKNAVGHRCSVCRRKKGDLWMRYFLLSLTKCWGRSWQI